MSKISFDSFIAFSKSLEGRTLNTVGGKARFTVSSVAEDRVVFTVESTGNKRPATKKWLEGVFALYEKTGSLRPGDYSDITHNASYVLKLLELYLKKNTK